MMNSETLMNIKGTLLQFLKNVPFSDKNNEILLSVVFDMLHMTTQEIKSIKEERSALKKVETPKKKSGSIFSKLLK